MVQSIGFCSSFWFRLQLQIALKKNAEASGMKLPTYLPNAAHNILFDGSIKRQPSRTAVCFPLPQLQSCLLFNFKLRSLQEIDISIYLPTYLSLYIYICKIHDNYQSRCSRKYRKKIKFLATLSAIMSAVIRGGNLITPVMPGSIAENHGDSGCYP